ncbi:helix-turn-helix transcriptional regulator [Streptomyces kurssanovii]|uniref:WYL domain-containing protein n=1 Tax=Streptomyces kurssanovii TaxID=67312 RepID=A0ABV3HXT7_9ACTN
MRSDIGREHCATVVADALGCVDKRVYPRSGLPRRRSEAGAQATRSVAGCRVKSMCQLVIQAIVLKAGRWYTVARAGGDLRTYRIGQIVALEPLDEVFDPPDRFDLARHWQAHTARLQERLWQGEAEIRISPAGIARLKDVAAQAVLEGVGRGKPEPGGWYRAVIPVESLEHAESELLRLGPQVEVLAPPELREGVAASARALATLYD